MVARVGKGGLPPLVRTLPIGVKMDQEVSDGEEQEAVQRGVQAK